MSCQVDFKELDACLATHGKTVCSTSIQTINWFWAFVTVFFIQASLYYLFGILIRNYNSYNNDKNTIKWKTY